MAELAAENSHYLARMVGWDSNTVAVCADNAQITYGELTRQAAAIAAELSARGIGPGQRVAIYMDREPELIPVLLGTLISGACYVPLETSYPKDRVLTMLGLAQPDLLVCSDSDQQWPEDIVCATPAELLAGSAASPSHPSGFDRAAGDPTYLIFTSGSTGTPKAVVMPDAALSNLLAWQSRQPRFAQPAQVLQFTPISFDVHFQEIFHTLATGGTLHLVPRAVRANPQRLLRFVSERGIERLYMPYVALAALAEASMAEPAVPLRLTDVVTAGEQLVSTAAIRAMFAQLPEARLHNQYGPSETHVVTAWTLDADSTAWPELPPIGVPISNVRTRVADAALAEVPSGTAGELLLGGLCLADGYFADAQRTAERFVMLDGERFYRTGDLVVQDAQGVLQFKGRIDAQIKIRGHRVEPGEIEARILDDADVAACAVASFGEGSSNRSLVAYVVAHPAAEPDLSALEQWQDVWDSTYSMPPIGQDPKLDTRGWNSSFNGEPLPAEQMQRWVQDTAERIRRLGPKRILELGAGTGLILFGMEGDYEYYQATDYSEVSVQVLRQWLSQLRIPESHVQASRLAAHEAHLVGSEPFDVVVINSLTQHFVSTRYLETVLQSAMQALAENGSVFLGDVTALNTREQYYASVVAHKAPLYTGAELLEEVERRAGTERELVIDPAYFLSLPQRLDNIGRVEIQLKGDGYLNELSRYRYDVVLHRRQADEVTPLEQRLEVRSWQPRDEVTSLQAWLDSVPEQSSVWIPAIPNARLQDAQRLLETAHQHPERAVQEFAQELPEQTGLDPAALERELNVRGRSFSSLFSGTPGCFDLLLQAKRPTRADEATALARAYHGRTIDSYASNPQDPERFKQLLQRLKQSLATSLPEYMVPARIVPLSRLPRTPSGKVDRRRLPAPATSRPDLAEPFVAPRGELELQLTDIWQRALELDQIGINDNFFDLGGNSILSLKLANSMSSALRKPVPIVALFQHPTIAGLAAALADDGKRPTRDATAVQHRAAQQRRAVASGRARLAARRDSRS